MKNIVLETIAAIVITLWMLSACAMDSDSLIPPVLNICCTLYLMLFSYANNWWD